MVIQPLPQMTGYARGMISGYHFFLSWQDKPRFNEQRAIALSLCGNIIAAAQLTK
jgi:hypothetical protein